MTSEATAECFGFVLLPITVISSVEYELDAWRFLVCITIILHFPKKKEILENFNDK